MKKATFSLIAMAAIFVAGMLLHLRRLEKQEQFMRFHCLDGTQWKGHFKGDAAAIQFVGGRMITTHLAAQHFNYGNGNSDAYECGKDGNIYYGCANCYEFIMNGNKLTGIDATEGAEFEKVAVSSGS